MASYTSLARPYAKAAFDIAKDKGDFASWGDALHFAAVILGDGGGRAVLATLAAARGVVDAVEHGGKVKLIAIARADLHKLAQAAALFARTPAVGTKFFAPDDDRACMFGRLNRHRHDAGWESCGIQPIDGWARTCAARIEGQDFGPAALVTGCGTQRYLEIA